MQTRKIFLVLLSVISSTSYPGNIIADLDQSKDSFVFYVSPKVIADSDGSIERPFSSLVEVQKMVRYKKNILNIDKITVILKNGIYNLSEPIIFNEEDSGTLDSIIEYKSEENGLATISGFTDIPLTKIERITNKYFLDDLKIDNQVSIYKVSLPYEFTQRIKLPPGDRLGSNSKRLMPEISVNGNAISISQWPDNEWMTAITEQTTNSIGDKVLRLKFNEKLPKTDTGSEYLLGFPIKDWAYIYSKITQTNRKNNYLEIKLPFNIKQKKSLESRWKIQNTFSGLKNAGRYLLDIENAILYFSLNKNQKIKSLKYSILNKPLMVFNNASYLKISGLNINGTASNGISVTNSHKIQINELNITSIGKIAVGIYGGDSNSITNTNIINTGSTGIYVGGGNREKLIRSNHLIYKNTISNYGRWDVSYSPGVKIFGVGVTVDSNSIFNGPHSGVIFSGNDHVIKNNEVFCVALSTGDVGAIYSGRDWTMRGNIIANNYIHDIRNTLNTGTVGIYLDDLFSGTQIYKNIIENTDKCILLGGGRDNFINKNLFVDCDILVWVDARGILEKKKKILSASKGSSWDIFGKASKMINNELYSTRYPGFSDLFDRNPLQPLGNMISDNTYQCGKEIVSSSREEFKKWYTIKNNLCKDESNIYTDKEGMLYDLRAININSE